MQRPIRDQWNDTRANKNILKLQSLIITKNHKRFKYISLPRLYIDFQNMNNTTDKNICLNIDMLLLNTTHFHHQKIQIYNDKHFQRILEHFTQLYELQERYIKNIYINILQQCNQKVYSSLLAYQQWVLSLECRKSLIQPPLLD